MKRTQALRKGEPEGTFIDGSHSERTTTVEASVRFSMIPIDHTSVRVQVMTTIPDRILRTSEEGFKEVVWLKVRRQSSRQAECWGNDHETEIIVRTDELNLLLDALTAAVALARADGVIPKRGTGPKLV